MIKFPDDWNELEMDCRLVHNCSDFQLAYASSRRDRAKERRLLKEQRSIARVHKAVRDSLEADPEQTKEQLTSSVLGLLAPWFISWLIPVFERLILDWILKRLIKD